MTHPIPIDDQLLEQLARRTERGCLKDAIDETFQTRSDRAIVVQELFDVGRDDWRFLAHDAIAGRCLDLRAGFGRRAHLLTELADHVIAADSRSSMLRLLAARSDMAGGDRVYPLHASVSTLPFEPNSFDTIVADWTGWSTDDVAEHLPTLCRQLKASGSLVLLLDGPLRHCNVFSFLGLGRPSSEVNWVPWRATPERYRSLLLEQGFDEVNVIGLLPWYRREGVCLDIANDRLGTEIAEYNLPLSGTLETVGRAILNIASWSGLSKSIVPSLCIVASQDSTDDDPQFQVPANSTTIQSGRVRSVALEYDGDDLERVWKLPNERGHQSVAHRESRLLDTLHNSEDEITTTLPTGNHIETTIGPVRSEEPVDGIPIKTIVLNDPTRFGEMLSLGLNWLATFQQTYEVDRIELTPSELCRRFDQCPVELPEPQLPEPVELPITAVHGDFVSENVYCRDGRVTGVIDWEYGVREGLPTVDVALFALDLGAKIFGDIETSAQNLFYSENSHATETERQLKRYADRMNFSSGCLRPLLPVSYLHRIELDSDAQTRSFYSGKLRDRAKRITNLCEMDVEYTRKPSP